RKRHTKRIGGSLFPSPAPTVAARRSAGMDDGPWIGSGGYLLAALTLRRTKALAGAWRCAAFFAAPGPDAGTADRTLATPDRGPVLRPGPVPWGRSRPVCSMPGHWAARPAPRWQDVCHARVVQTTSLLSAQLSGCLVPMCVRSRHVIDQTTYTRQADGAL